MKNNPDLDIKSPQILLIIILLALNTVASSSGPGDLEVIKQRFLAPLLVETNDVRHIRYLLGPMNTKGSWPDIDYNNRLKYLLGSLNTDGGWPDIDYNNRHRASWETLRHLHSLLLLARAYKSPVSELYHNARIKKSIHSALDYWLRHDFKNPNWWYNVIGTPKTLSSILLLLDEELSPSQRQKGMEILERAKLGRTGQNLVWVAEITAMRGVLERNPEITSQALDRIVQEIRITTDEGIQPDYSFHQHGSCLYNHGYGAIFASNCARIVALCRGTQFAFPPEKVEILSNYILDGSQWMTLGEVCDYGALGRQISRKNQTADYLRPAVKNMLELTTGRENEFKALAARLESRSAPPLQGNRFFWRSEIMTHHRSGYYSSVRMFSRNLANTDVPCNQEGLKSHHIADGCNFIFCSGKEYHDIFPVWDWQKIPGTTVEQTPELPSEVRIMGNRSFVGGVSDGNYGLAAFDFARGELLARKAWFFFDREIVCLGAGIDCNSDNPVVTTINQCHLKGDVIISESDKARKIRSGNHFLNNIAWIHHDRVAYLFPQSTKVHLSNDFQKGSWRSINHAYSDETIAHPVFKLWIDHGRHCQNANYAYIVLPDVSPAAANAYAARPVIEIVRNTSDIQAVRHNKDKITGIAFYKPGLVEIAPGLNIAVDQPGLVLIRELPGMLSISVSNPKDEKIILSVEVNLKLRGDGVHTLPDKSLSRIIFDIPDGMYAGRSMNKTIYSAND